MLYQYFDDGHLSHLLVDGLEALVLELIYWAQWIDVIAFLELHVDQL
jgi:hypothetical protein